MSIDINNPQPGVYENVPEADYHAVKAMNWSSLKLGLEHDYNMNAVMKALDGGEHDTTAAKEFGTKAHEALLLPSEYEKRELLPDMTQKSTSREGKITYKEMQQINLQVSNLKQLFSRHHNLIDVDRGRNEVVYIWIEMVEGVAVVCKARVDNRTGKQANDLKTTVMPTPFRFMRFANQACYGGQAAFYSRGITKCGEELEGFNFWTSLKAEPFTAGFAPTPEHVIAEWDDIVSDLLYRWVHFDLSVFSNFWECPISSPPEYYMPEIVFDD